MSSFGGKLKQYEIAVDPVRLASMELTLVDVFDALGRRVRAILDAELPAGTTSFEWRLEDAAGRLPLAVVPALDRQNAAIVSDDDPGHADGVFGGHHGPRPS